MDLQTQQLYISIFHMSAAFSQWYGFLYLNTALLRRSHYGQLSEHFPFHLPAPGLRTLSTAPHGALISGRPSMVLAMPLNTLAGMPTVSPSRMPGSRRSRRIPSPLPQRTTKIITGRPSHGEAIYKAWGYNIHVCTACGCLSMRPLGKSRGNAIPICRLGSRVLVQL